MRHWLWIAAAAGLISALLFVSSVLGSPYLRFLAVTAQVPIFMAGLALRWPAVVLAGLVGTACLWLLANEVGGLLYLGLIAIAPAVLTHRAMRTREAANGSLVWYPEGRLLLWLAALGAGLPAAALLAYGVLQGGLVGPWFELAARWVNSPQLAPELERMRETLSDPTSMPSNQELATMLARFLPVAITFLLTLATGFFGVLSHFALVGSRLARRPALDLAQVQLPAWFFYGFVGVLLLNAVRIGGPDFEGPLLVLRMAATAMTVAYFFLGLAVVHDISRPWRARATFLALFYVVIVFLTPLALAAVVVGLIENAFGLRARLGRGRPPTT